MDVDLQTLMSLVAAARGSALTGQKTSLLQNLPSLNLSSQSGSLRTQHPILAKDLRQLELRGSQRGGSEPNKPEEKSGVKAVGAVATASAITSGNTSGNKRKNIRLHGFIITIETIIISALIFISILSWFEVFRVWYVTTFETTDPDLSIIYFRFFYAISVTTLVLVLLYIIYHISAKLNLSSE